MEKICLRELMFFRLSKKQKRMVWIRKLYPFCAGTWKQYIFNTHVSEEESGKASFFFFLSCGKLQNNNSKHRKRNVDMELLYRSTRGAKEPVTASKAILQGLAEDGGLFVPDSIPKLTCSMELLAGMIIRRPHMR